MWCGIALMAAGMLISFMAVMSLRELARNEGYEKGYENGLIDGKRIILREIEQELKP
jgi:hypothetical protein